MESCSFPFILTVIQLDLDLTLPICVKLYTTLEYFLNSSILTTKVQMQERFKLKVDASLTICNTAVPPYPLIQYARFQLSATYLGLEKNFKIK
jgi:hypothetical protein